MTAPSIFWWRDDDAAQDHPNLVHLIQLSETHGVPLALAVVPDLVDERVVERIRAAHMRVTVLQHGIAHENHGLPDEKKVELGGAAERDMLIEGLRRGRARLAHFFGDRFLDILVPPWNRIRDDVLSALPSVGFVGWSGFAARCRRGSFSRIDTHVDLVDWRGTGRGWPFETVRKALLDRAATMAGEPIGLLSHHLVTTPDGFSTLDRALQLVQHQNNCRWINIRDWIGKAE
ncbi:MAG: hypothetical protein ACFB6S_16555 [Geminicoccaceae bacterium]